MQADIAAGSAMLAQGRLVEARQCLRRALEQELSQVEERVCRNRLREVEDKIRSRASVARISVESGMPDGDRFVCRVKVVSPDASIHHMTQKVFTHTVRHGEGEDASIEKTGNALTAVWTGRQDGLVCGACKRFRAMVKDNLGRDAFLEKSGCRQE